MTHACYCSHYMPISMRHGLLSVIILVLAVALSWSRFTDDLIELENARFREVKEYLISNDIHVQGFYHMSKIQPHWISVLRDFLLTLNGLHRGDDYSLRMPAGGSRGDSAAPILSDGLLSILEKLNIFIANVNDVRIYHENVTVSDVIDTLHSLGPGRMQRTKSTVSVVEGISVHRDSYQQSVEQGIAEQFMAEQEKIGATSGEYPSIMALQEYCHNEVRHHRQSIVFYAHLKSAGEEYNGPNSHPIAYWRELMSVLNIEFPSICLRALADGNSACGAMYRFTPSSHFSGNYWWASCSHISKLPPLYSPLFGYIDAEMFPLRVGSGGKGNDFSQKCVYESFGDRTSSGLYDERVTPDNYVPALIKHLESKDLSPCGYVNATVGGSKHPPLTSSYACPRSGRKNRRWKGAPCLSVRTDITAKFVSSNPYHISNDVIKAWGHSFNTEYMKYCLNSSCAANFTFAVNNMWP